MGHTPHVGKPTDGTGELHSKDREHIGWITSDGAGVVLRATVETFGTAGDTELNLTVKWPAAALAAAKHGASEAEKHKQGPDHKSDEDGYDTEGNIHTEASRPPIRN